MSTPIQLVKTRAEEIAQRRVSRLLAAQVISGSTTITEKNESSKEYTITDSRHSFKLYRYAYTIECDPGKTRSVWMMGDSVGGKPEELSLPYQDPWIDQGEQNKLIGVLNGQGIEIKQRGQVIPNALPDTVFNALTQRFCQVSWQKKAKDYFRCLKDTFLEPRSVSSILINLIIGLFLLGPVGAAIGVLISLASIAFRARGMQLERRPDLNAALKKHGKVNDGKWWNVASAVLNAIPSTLSFAVSPALWGPIATGISLVVMICVNKLRAWWSRRSGKTADVEKSTRLGLVGVDEFGMSDRNKAKVARQIVALKKDNSIKDKLSILLGVDDAHSAPSRVGRIRRWAAIGISVILGFAVGDFSGTVFLPLAQTWLGISFGAVSVAGVGAVQISTLASVALGAVVTVSAARGAVETISADEARQRKAGFAFINETKGADSEIGGEKAGALLGDVVNAAAVGATAPLPARPDTGSMFGAPLPGVTAAGLVGGGVIEVALNVAATALPPDRKYSVEVAVGTREMRYETPTQISARLVASAKDQKIPQTPKAYLEPTEDGSRFNRM